MWKWECGSRKERGRRTEVRFQVSGVREQMIEVGIGNAASGHRGLRIGGKSEIRMSGSRISIGSEIVGAACSRD